MLKFCVRLLPLCSRGRCLWFACNIAALGFGYPGPHRMSWAAFRFRRGWGGAAVSLGVFEGTREASGARVFSGGAFSAGHSASTVDRDSLGHPPWFMSLEASSRVARAAAHTGDRMDSRWVSLPGGLGAMGLSVRRGLLGASRGDKSGWPSARSCSKPPPCRGWRNPALWGEVTSEGGPRGAESQTS